MKRKKDRLSLIFVAILLVAIFIAVLSLFGQFISLDPNVMLLMEAQVALQQKDIVRTLEILEQIKSNLKVETKVPYASKSKASVIVPAVDQSGNGVTAEITIEIQPGTGRILFDVQNVLSYFDTQDSARTAIEVAENITQRDLSNSDVFVIIRSDAPVVEGSSAGAAMAVASIAAIEDKLINSSVMITGTVNHDGTIGLVGEVETKAEAVKAAGATLFLVPLKQSEEVVYEANRHCVTRGAVEYCKIEYVPRTVNIGEELEIDVQEVGHISEAAEAMIVGYGI